MKVFCAGVVELANTAVLKTAALSRRLQVRTLPPALGSTIAPMVVGTTTGVQIRATEAAQTQQVHYTAFGSRDQEEIAHDLPLLFCSMQT
jgi:hypothetical protein